MSFMQKSPLGDVTRGGQLLLHFFRMLGQVVRKFAALMATLALLIAATYFLKSTDEYDRYLAGQYWVGNAKQAIFRRQDETTSIRRRDGSRIETTIGQTATSPTMAGSSRRVLVQAAAGLIVGVLVVLGTGFGIGAFIWRTGRRQRLEQHVRGSTVVKAYDMRRILERHGIASDVTIAGIPLVAGTETAHLLVTGTTGSGKSQAMLELLQSIRRRGDRVICFSPSGDFVSAFYRPDRDVLLNPFDRRCPSWNLWADCPNPYDYDALATALIPPSVHTSDPFWNDSARKIVAATARELARQPTKDLRQFLDVLTVAPLEELHKLLANTDAGPLTDPSTEKTALSIRSNVSNYVAPLKYLPQDRTPFHIREWVMKDSQDEWVFLNATDAQLASVRPVLSMWLEVLTNALLGLPASQTRRVWLVIDELPVLQKIPSLEDFLARSRKHGGCAAIAFQSPSQLREKYGEAGAQTITGLCNTWVCLLQRDYEAAKWVAKAFGEFEVIESNQGVSYGANDMRDGVSLSNQRRLRPLVLESEIMALAPMNGFMRLAGGLPNGTALPACRFDFPYREYPNQVQPFLPAQLGVASNPRPAASSTEGLVEGAESKDSTVAAQRGGKVRASGSGKKAGGATDSETQLQMVLDAEISLLPRTTPLVSAAGETGRRD